MRGSGFMHLFVQLVRGVPALTPALPSQCRTAIESSPDGPLSGRPGAQAPFGEGRVCKGVCVAYPDARGQPFDAVIYLGGMALG